jgi:hypothetical protein
MPSTDTKPELTAKASMAQPVSQPAVYANGLSEEYGLKMFKHTSQICGCKSERITGDSGIWRIELHDLYLPDDQIKQNEMHGHVECVGEKNVYRILVGKPERKRWLCRPRHRWAGNITRDLTEIRWEGVD